MAFIELVVLPNVWKPATLRTPFFTVILMASKFCPSAPYKIDNLAPKLII